MKLLDPSHSIPYTSPTLTLITNSINAILITPSTIHRLSPTSTIKSTSTSLTINNETVPIQINDLIRLAPLLVKYTAIESNEWDWTQKYSLLPAIPPTAKKRYYTASKLKERIATFSSSTLFTLECITWNVAGAMKGVSGSSDVVVIGLQEADSSVSGYVITNDTLIKQWIRITQEELSGYSLVTSKQLVGIVLLVYSRIPVREVTTCAVPSGILGLFKNNTGILGNKGCVGVRMRVFDSYLTIINSHLAAGSGSVDKRNADFAYQAVTAEFTCDPDWFFDNPVCFL